MRTAKGMALLMIAMVMGQARAQPLPRNAKIVVDGQFTGGMVGEDLHGCREATTTPLIIREKFARFHRISQSELHDLYDFVDCGVQGTISVGARRYTWRLYLTDVLRTTYPDGRMHFMAGKPDRSD